MNTLELINQIKSKRTLYENNETRLVDLNTEVINLGDKLKKDQEKQALYENVVFACKLILEKLTKDSKIKLEMFLTYAVQSIFTDKNYEIKLNVREDTKNPNLEIMLVEDGVEQEIKDAVGGGILSTLGLLLQIYYLEAYGLSKTMFIDEGLKEVSTSVDGTQVSYLNNLLDFLKYLSDKKGYTFVIVTHDENVKNYADVLYNVDEGKVKRIF